MCRRRHGRARLDDHAVDLDGALMQLKILYDTDEHDDGEHETE